MGLTAGDLDAEHSSHFGVASDLLWCCTQLGEESLAVNRRTVGLDVGGLEEFALEGLVACQAGVVLDAVLDCVGLLGQCCDLGQESAEGVNVVGGWGGDGSSHVAVFLCYLTVRNCFVSDASVIAN